LAKGNVWKELRLLVEKVPSPSGFSGWSENYLFCNEANFELFPCQEIKRGTVVKGIYRFPVQNNSQED
jgi:hypothetical protein